VADFLKDLNDAQREAVMATEGPSLVIAGAGSGKTRVLTYRIAYLLSRGIRAGNILALTFTNKAAREMKDRISGLVGLEASRYVWMGTFHSIFSRILRKEGKAMGYSSTFTIYDTQDSRHLIKNIVKELQLDEKIYTPGEVLSRISSAKNNLITPQGYADNAAIIRQDEAANKPRMAEIYQLYASRCRKSDAMDFDDLLLNTSILFRDFPEVLHHYQQQFQYILVDEYQDTNYVQYLIIYNLGTATRNICVVGDDAQSIYSFRGARIENILNFRNDYPGYNLFKLEQNYRSTKTIVNAANSIIAKNKEQIQKKVWSALETGDKIRVIRANTDGEEGFVIASDIHESHFTRQVPWTEIAILYRTNAQSRIFEESLRKKNIPYKIYGGLSFYQRKEIKDLLAYFRLLVNPNDDEAFMRVINYPARGIGNTTLEKVELIAKQNDTSLWSVITGDQALLSDINRGIRTKMAEFALFIEAFRQKLDETDAWELAMEVAEKTGILRELNQDKSPEGISRHENIQELLNSIREFCDRNKEEGPVNLVDFLGEVSLLTDMDNEKDEDRDKITLMTVHSAKGLEFAYVYIVGVEEGLFPSHLSANTPKETEEERRLFYVALTRAKTQAIISWALMRYRWGTPTSCSPSRFIKDIDPQYLELLYNDSNQGSHPFRIPGGHNLFNNASLAEPSPVKHTQVVLPPPSPARLTKMSQALKKPKPADSTADNQKTDHLAVGMTVVHDRFGIGTVLSLEGQAPDIKAQVEFKDHGKKQLLLKFARLRIVN